MKYFYFLFFIFIVPSFSWNEEGHMIIAQIAYKQLDQYCIEQIDNMINIFNNFFPKFSNRWSAATWMDKIKTDHIKVFSDWHFINRPFNPQSVSIHNYSKINIIWCTQ